MAREVYYKLLKHGQVIAEGSIKAPFTVGRQNAASEPEPVSILEPPGGQSGLRPHNMRKLVIVPLSDRSVPRLFLKVDIDSQGKLSVDNLHRTFEMMLSNNSIVPPDGRADLGIRGSLYFSQHFQLKLSLARDSSVPSVPARAPGRQERDNLAFSALMYSDEPSEVSQAPLQTVMFDDSPLGRPDLAIHLVQTVLEAFKAPSGSDEFFAAAGNAAVKMVDLDRVAILFKNGDEWICRGQSFRPDGNAAVLGKNTFSRTLLAKMEDAGRTMIMEPQLSDDWLAVSMDNVERAVAAPIFDRENLIVGALYGDRALGQQQTDRPIGELEAAMLDVLASGISSSLIIEQEQQLRNSMSPFFSPEVLSQLSSNRGLLDSREADVSVLFCDIRGFSSVTEKIGPAMAISWINDILTALSECVLKHDGVLVDYVGDELMAMFGAPTTQPDHAERACRAALEMLSLCGPLGEKWKGIVSDEFCIGIGINSGTASVGNTGSQKKFKYGPLGNTVNLASRVLGITKQIGVSELITGQTAAALDPAEFQTRRLAKVSVVGIETPIDIYQLCQQDFDRRLCTRYEKALAAYERFDLKMAVGLAASLLQQYPEDRPTITLLSRTAEYLNNQSETEFDPVWRLTRK